MKTPLQELLEWESNLSQMFDSDQRIAMAVLTYIRDNREEMIEKENKLIKITGVLTGEDAERLNKMVEENNKKKGSIDFSKQAEEGKKILHKAKVLSKEEVEKGRSNAYEYIKLNSVPEEEGKKIIEKFNKNMEFPKENMLDNWLEKNHNPEIDKQVEEEIQKGIKSPLINLNSVSEEEVINKEK